MTDHRHRQLAITAQDEHPGASLIRMLVVGLILIVLGMFAVVFIASPLALLTGLRLSSVWAVEGPLASPATEKWARAVHYPVMLFFLAFTFVHVVLVFTTGALAKLNQMYAARDEDDWVGFVVFAASVVVMVVAWVLAKPPLLKRIAASSGRVQG